MSYTSTALPAFPAALIPHVVVAPSPLFFSPATVFSANPQASYSQSDPFANGSRLWNRVEAKHSGIRFIDQCPIPSDPPLLIQLDTAMQRLRDLKAHIKAARRARSENDRITAASKYEEALRLLEMPADHVSNVSLFKEVIDGESLFKEALFGTTGFSSPERVGENITRLKKFIDDPPENTSPLDIVKAKLLKTYVLFRHAASAHDPQVTQYQRALHLTDEAIEEFPGEHEAADDVIFYGNLLSIEIHTHLLAHAHNRGDHKEEFIHADEIKSAFKRIAASEMPPERLSIIGDYKSDVAIFMARVGLWGEALEMAREVTASDSQFSDTPSAQRLFSEDIFQSFIEDTTAGKAFLKPNEIKLRAKQYSLIRRIMMAIAMAYSEGLKQSAMYGSIGLIAGILADFAILQGGHTMIAGAAGAAAASAFNSLRNGWATPEAIYASEIGEDGLTWQQSAMDVTKLMMKSGVDVAAWMIPAAVVDAGMDGIRIAADTLSRAADLYYQFGEWTIANAPALVQSDTYRNLIDSISSMDATQAVYHAYTGAAGLFYLTYLTSSRARSITNRWAWLFLPGAMMLSADLGMLINSDRTWIDRVQRSGIAAGEMLLLMLTAGLLPFENRSSLKKGMQSFFNLINPLSKQSSYALPLTGALLTNVCSAMGGMMQKGTDPSELSLTLTAIQGTATIVGMLGIVLGITGVLKAQVPLVSGIKEGWQDSIGESLHKRTLAVILGALDAFQCLYTQNRVFRAGTWDQPAGILRTMFGWDTNAGQIAMSASCLTFCNGISTATWPETSGTQWERDQIIKVTEWKNLAQIHDFFIKAGQVMHPLHILLSHGSLRAQLWPLISWTRGGFPPAFPHSPNAHLYANLHQLINGGNVEALNKEQMDTLLEYVRMYSHDPDNHVLMRPFVQTLALARESELHGHRIKEFFQNNIWIAELLDVDLDTHTPPTDRFRRKVRKAVRKAIGKLPIDQFEVRTKSHGRQQKGAHHFDHIFTVHQQHSPTELNNSKEVEPNREAEASESVHAELEIVGC